LQANEANEKQFLGMRLPSRAFEQVMQAAFRFSFLLLR